MKLLILVCIFLTSKHSYSGDDIFRNWQENISASIDTVKQIQKEKKIHRRGKKFALEIKKHYPKDKYHVIGLGRSVGLTMAYLRALGYKDFDLSEIPVENLVDFTKLSDEQKDLFFKKIIPSKKRLKKRKLVIHRVLWGSMTMKIILSDLVDYLERNNYPLPLENYFIVDKPVSKLPLGDYLKKNKELKKKIKIRQLKDSFFQQTVIEEIDKESLNPDKIITNASRFKPISVESILNKKYIRAMAGYNLNRKRFEVSEETFNQTPDTKSFCSKEDVKLIFNSLTK